MVDVPIDGYWVDNLYFFNGLVVLMKGGDIMNFGDAFEAVKSGRAMRLPGWKEDVTIKAQYPDEHSKMTTPYLYVESRYGRVPWKETMIELFSEEWEVV